MPKKPGSRKKQPAKKTKPVSKTPAPSKPVPYLPLPKPKSRSPVFSVRQRLETQFEKSLARPKVSVVIVNYNGVDFLWNCLFALKTQTYPPYEIILVDNASNDASISFVKTNYPQIKILECQENFGFAMGSNLGATYATGDLVALLNNDAVVTPDWLDHMVKDFRENWPLAGVLSSLVKSKKKQEGPERRVVQTLNFLGRPMEVFFENSKTIFYPEGSSFIYARFLATQGPFDSDYFIYEEDVYFGWKLRLLNWQVKKSATAKVFHEEGGTMSLFPEWKGFYYRSRNRWLNLFLFYEMSNLIKVLPWIGMDILACFIRSLVTGFSLFLGNFLALVWILTHLGTIWRKRREIQEKRKVSDREILKCLSGRMAKDKGVFSRFLNFFSLAYCGVVGLGVAESREED
jgi:GT2 family glycosyltransferase